MERLAGRDLHLNCSGALLGVTAELLIRPPAKMLQFSAATQRTGFPIMVSQQTRTGLQTEGTKREFNSEFH